ncbi:hypothetical protein CCR75_000335 [Bremia lactucae]|uniref:WHIM1 domain-containing protein n=1 Tax=Bremia lactucae TaxID=4779 RepID=A0A976FL06_BRELC|nr:hypothetical protein CCR75_000335 [Bremia lactucae]
MGMNASICIWVLVMTWQRRMTIRVGQNVYSLVTLSFWRTHTISEMARNNNVAKRCSPSLIDLNVDNETNKKLMAAADGMKMLNPTVRSGPFMANENALDAVEAGDDAPTSIIEANVDVNHKSNDDLKMTTFEVTAALNTRTNDKKRTSLDNSILKKPGKKRAKPTGKVLINGQSEVRVYKTKTKAKSRTQAVSKPKKQSQKAPPGVPFFVETGVEWNNTNIDFNELSVLRSLWELPAACHLLWLLQSPLTLRFSNTLLEYEAALLKPEESPVLEDVFTKLLLKKSERTCLSAGIGLKYEWWNKQLRIYYLDMYDKWYALLRKAGERLPETFSEDEDDENSSISGSETDEQVDVELTDDEWLTLDILKARLETLGLVCPLKYQSYADLSIELRCKILLNLCEAVVDDPANTEYMRQMEEDDLRVEPLGNDRAGNRYYFFPQFYEERRLYQLDSKTQHWALWAKGDDAFHAMLHAMKQTRGRPIHGEQELIDHLEVIVEQIADEKEVRARQLEKANRIAILEAIPRKRSLRLQVKQLEKVEKHQQHEKELSMEEIAEMKRAEFLAKVEREAEKEARDAERESRRLHREQIEREEAQTERERRRIRRIENEMKEDQGEVLVETDGRKEEVARESQQDNATL